MSANGWFNRERVNDETNKYHDIIIYNRKLTEKEIKDYELDFINSED